MLHNGKSLDGLSEARFGVRGGLNARFRNLFFK